MAGDIRVGISGWRYEPWRGHWYPDDLVQRRELEYTAGKLDAVEVNGTFYSLQRPDSFRAWRDETPDDFRFAIKGGRFITHIKRLNIEPDTLGNFFAQGLLALGPKLGPVLWQVPPTLKFDAERVERFLAMLPSDTHQLADLASRHDGKLRHGAVTQADAKRPVRHVMEVRHASFRDEAFVKLLRRYRVGLVLAETPGHWEWAEDVTCPVVYLRMHGSEQMYEGSYGQAALRRLARRLRTWAGGGEPAKPDRIADLAARKRKGRQVWCFFDNTMKRQAPFDALQMRKHLKLEPRGGTLPEPPGL
jgi:uncharacterized protein YecE (DUF72 family)